MQCLLFNRIITEDSATQRSHVIPLSIECWIMNSLELVCFHESLKYLLAPLWDCCITFGGFKHSLGTVAPDLWLWCFSVWGTTEDLSVKGLLIVLLAFDIHLLSLNNLFVSLRCGTTKNDYFKKKSTSLNSRHCTNNYFIVPYSLMFLKLEHISQTVVKKTILLHKKE